MFESVTPDAGNEGLTKAARFLYALAILLTIFALMDFGFAVLNDHPPPLSRLVIDFVLAGAAVIAGHGVGKQRRWALWLGVVVALFELPNFPAGTCIGALLIVYLFRARRAGLFTPAS
ncbi:MAG TPA: hypothetical protein VI670_19555 [Thermoanaerobaculia bacterium]